MNRTLVLLTAALALGVFLPLPGEADRAESRRYVLGLGVGLPPDADAPPATTLCPDLALPFEVCFPILAGDAAVAFEIEDAYQTVAPVVGTMYFEDALGLPTSGFTRFCGSSGSQAIPAGAATVKVLVGPLANATETLPSCPTGVGVVGSVRASFT